jgi:hypothetical protein
MKSKRAPHTKQTVHDRRLNDHIMQRQTFSTRRPTITFLAASLCKVALLYCCFYCVSRGARRERAGAFCMCVCCAGAKSMAPEASQLGQRASVCLCSAVNSPAGQIIRLRAEILNRYCLFLSPSVHF